MSAASNPNPDVAKALIDAGADVNARNIVNHTALMCAAERNENPDVVRLLINAGASVNAKNHFEDTPFTLAVLVNQNPDVAKVISEAGANANARVSIHENTIKTLVANYPREVVEEMCNICKMETVLTWVAAFNTNASAVKELIDMGSDVNAKDYDGKTALMWAAQYNKNPDVIKLLLEAGADATVRDNSWKMAIDYFEARKDKDTFFGTTSYWAMHDLLY